MDIAFAVWKLILLIGIVVSITQLNQVYFEQQN